KRKGVEAVDRWSQGRSVFEDHEGDPGCLSLSASALLFVWTRILRQYVRRGDRRRGKGPLGSGVRQRQGRGLRGELERKQCERDFGRLQGRRGDRSRGKVSHWSGVRRRQGGGLRGELER